MHGYGHGQIKYYTRQHQGIAGKTPIERWRDDLVNIRQLGFKANKLDDIFCHRIERKVRKDATIFWENRVFEVNYKYANYKVILVVDPHTKKALQIESLKGENLGSVVLLDKIANLNRKRNRPEKTQNITTKQTDNMVEIAYQKHINKFTVKGE
jgi:hypothetical protein